MSRNTGSRACAAWRSPKANVTLGRIALLISLACAEEFRGSSSDPSTFKQAKQSSTAYLEGALTSADKAVDGDTGGHLYFSAGCAITEWEANPWWRVDLGSLIPMAVVRIYPRTDNPSFTRTGLQMRVGVKDSWDENPVCASDIALQTVGVTAVNCFAGGRFVFIGAPNTDNARLSICEIDVVIRGPKEVKQYLGAIGRPMDIRVEGVGLLSQDRLRIVKPSVLCGSAAADSMDDALVERTRPYGAPEVESNEVEKWTGVEFLKMGFYKMCWCSGMFSCVSGADFNFLIGFGVITGEMRTIAGNGTDPVRNVDEWEDLYTVRVGAVSGLAISEDGMMLYWSEPHRVREANMVNGSVRTLVGDLIAGNCVEPLLSGHVCGDGLPGTMARLHDPRGLAVCRGELLIADYLNSRIRAYDLTTGIITTKVGSDHGYAGDGGAPHQAKLSGPAGVVCDELRGYWIADTGNSAIRGVRVTPGQSDVITTVVGGLGQGLASPGTWSTQAKLNHPMQLAMSVRWGAPRSLVYVESWNAVARFLPLGSRVMEGAVQQVIGTGSTGHVTSVGGKNIQLNRPEGVAVHSSTAFVADTMNHRIIMVPILEYEPLGCFKEVTVEGESTLVPTLEGDMEAGLSPAEGPCGEEMLDVNDAVARCAHATMRKGWEVFAVRCGGVCASAADADRWYRFNGASTTCEKGRGGLMANSAYRLIKEHAKDLLGNFYVIAGQALTTEALQEAEKPRAGYFGDRLASWLSAMDEPSQLAASATTRNIFFGDRGNNRVRVIFGSLGPQPQTQQFYCTNGLECVLNVEGNGFSEKDHIAFSRDYFTAPVVCGQDRLEEQFPQVHNLAQWSRLFLNKDFNLARISLPVVGQFIVCYCIGNVGKECDVTKEYEFKAGRLHVVGPNARSTVYALAGVPFDLALFGAAFRLTDRIRLIRMNETCGAGGETPVDDMLPFVRVPGNSSLKAGLGPWDEGTETYQVWRDLIIDEATELKVCWCDVAPCPYDSHFKVEAMYLSVGGPTQKTQVVEFGQRFDLLLEGPGGFKAADRVRLQDAQVPCNSPQRRADLEDALPLDATPCEISATSVRWCGVKIPLSAPSSLVACWCGALGGFNATNYTGVPAVWLTVNPGPPLQTDAGPVYRRDLPVPPLSDSGWPSYINKGTYNISARLYARFGWGAGSPGPIQVAICEMPDRCLLPLELREFTSGGLVVAEASRVWDGTTLFPRAVKVSSLSTDLFLAEFVDVELLGQWRRFPLNRWLLMQEHLTDATVWETFTAPPLPTAAPAQSHYTEGDRCGGCGLGTICRERPQTALELAQKGISLATATEVFMTWDCQFACGDGLVVGEEQCDDGNLDALDGCDANCKVEPGFVCDGSHGFAPSQCRAIGCGAAPHPSQHISAACEDPSNLPDAVACRSPAELSACGRLSEPSLFAGCPGASDLRCDLAPVRPKAVLAQFVDQGNFLLVAFDAALAAWNGTDLGEEIPCSEFFTPTTVAELGDRAACIQGSPQHLLVRLGFGASLGEAATAVFVLDTARQYQQINSPVEVSRVFEFPAQRLFLGPALGETSNFVKPTVILRGPTVWGQCGDLHLDGSFSLGSTGRPWKLIRWRCTGDGSSCAKIVGYLPNSCDQQTPLETTGLAVGPVPCGLRATIPEAVASDLTISLATLEIHLKLENAMGLWDEAVHRIRFTVDRVPMAVALSDPAMTVDEGSSVRLELSVGPALPVASLGAGSSCGALGPVSLEWRYSYGSLLDPSQAWPSLTNTPPSLIASLDAKTAALEGTLGDLDVPGSNWTLVARVFHTAENAAPVDVPFFLMVRPQPPSIKLQAPSEISNTCGFSVVAHAGGISGDPYVTWKCLFLDVVSVTEPVSTECAARAMQARGAVLGLPALTPGVYQIDATLDDPSKPSDTIFVRVSATAGPQVRILEPIEPRMLRGDEAQVRFRARLEATACGASAMAAALVVRSSVPGEATQLARPSMVLATKVMNFSQDVQPDDNFEAWIQLSSLPVGLSHTFELLLAESSQARQAKRDYTSSLASFPTWEPPAEVWAYRSAPVTHVMSPAVELFVDPPTGFDSRTLFTLRARALCEGCLYSFRLAPRLANDTSNDCDRATGSWQELRPLSSDPEAILPLLQGTYLLEVQVTPPAGGTARACTTVEVTKSNLDPTFSGLTSAEVEELVQTWTSDASRSIATLRALQRPSLLVESLESIAQEFPKAANLDGDTATKTESALRQLYTEVCEGVQDAVLLLPASEFTDTARRLSSGSTGLRSTMLSLLACMDALFPLLTLTELWQTLQVLNTVLDRNAQLLGLLGPGTSGQPWASYPMLALTDLVLVKAFYVANATSSVVVRSNTTALVDTAMLAALQIGHVAAATGPVSSTTPVEVRNQGRSLVVSSLSLPGQSLATSGLHLAHTTQPIDDLPYPGLTIPVMGTGIYEELTQNVTSSALLPLCLGGASLMGRLDLLIIHWGFNTIGVGERVGSSAPSGGVLVSVRDVRLRSCGVDVPLSPAALDQQEVEMLVELPEEVLDERRWGYGNIEPFRCVRWVSSGVGRPGQWLTEGCTSVYRAKDEEAVGDKAGLEEGVLRCRCKSLIPGTWAVEIVPRPPVIVEPPVVMNVSVRTLVAYGVLILWLPFLVPLLVWAVVGDLILSLYGQEVSKKLAEGLLPSSLLYGGIWGDAEQQLERAPWPLRCDVSLRVVATWLFLRSYCGKASRTRWRDEAKEISRYRDALCYARLKGARVVDSAEVKAIEAAPQRPAQDPTIRERAPVARWRAGPGAAAASPEPKAVKAPVQPPGTTQEQPKLLNHQPDPVGALLKQPDAYEEQQAKQQAALNMTEYDWSEQVRGQVTTTGVQRNALPEGWISQSAGGGQLYYVNLLDGKSSWERPTQPAVKVLSMQELRELLGPASDGVALRRQLEEMLRPRIAERLAAMEDVQAAGQDRRLQAEAHHMAPAPEEEAAEAPETLRQAALVQVEPPPEGDFQHSLSAGDGSLRIPLRFRALSWGFCGLFGACFLRSWPITAALIPCLRPSRLERAAKFAYRLNAALAFAAGACGLQVIAEMASLDEEVSADTRPDGELWAEMEVLHPMAIAVGLLSVLVGGLVAGLLPVFAAVRPKEFENFGVRSAWWRKAWMKQRQTEGFTLFLGLGAGFLAVVLAALKPQPRASLAFSAFFWAVLTELLLLPLTRTLLQTMTIYCAARDCCCGQLTLLARLPGLLQFPHEGSWTSSALLLKHLEALNSEASPRHQVKR